MYLNFYRLEKAPFNITPDPEFLFLSASHKEALGAIIYCITKRKGFASIIGEVGTGKTTIVRSYLARSDRKKVKPIYVFNPSVTFGELLKTVFRELGFKPPSENLYDLVHLLHTILIKEFYEKDRNVVLIIDEAQNMPVSTFEQLRILSNLETPKEKLLQIVLVGQPELADKLAGKELRQLNQRLAIRATLQPLSPAESRDYILFRLAKVTKTPDQLFTAGALKKIIRAAKGSPRMLNILCDNALVAGFGYQEIRVTGSIAKQVIADFEGKRHPLAFTWKHATIIGAVLLSATVLNEIHQPFKPFNVSGFWPDERSAPVSSRTRPEPEAARQAPLPAPVPRSSESDLLSAGPIVISRTSAPAVAPGTGTGKDDGPQAVEAIVPGRRRVKAGTTARTVRQGEHLSQICLERYGFVDDRLIAYVKDHNPRIFDADLIFVGDRIYLPEFTRTAGKAADSHWR